MQIKVKELNSPTEPVAEFYLFQSDNVNPSQIQLLALVGNKKILLGTLFIRSDKIGFNRYTLRDHQQLFITDSNAFISV